jgi:hypothetical protein
MISLKEQLAQKEKELANLKGNKSKSFCTETHTSQSYMRFTMEMEELEDEVADLKKKIAAGGEGG